MKKPRKKYTATIDDGLGFLGIESDWPSRVKLSISRRGFSGHLALDCRGARKLAARLIAAADAAADNPYDKAPAEDDDE